MVHLVISPLDENTLHGISFIGTGTGIAPFHSMTGSYPGLNYTLLHGVRYGMKPTKGHHYPEERYMLCTSRDQEGDFNGRVTDYLRQMTLNSDTLVYLCGNCDMIYDVYDLLILTRFSFGKHQNGGVFLGIVMLNGVKHLYLLINR